MTCSSVNLLLRIALPLGCADSSLLPWFGWRAAGHGKRRLLYPAKPIEALTGKLERVKATIRARVKRPFRVIKRQFGHIKVRYRGRAKNTAQLHTLFALANLRMERRKLLATMA